LFFIVGAYFVFTESIIRTEDYLSGIAMGITIIGIGFAIGSLNDIKKLIKKEKGIVSNPEKFKKETNTNPSSQALVLVCWPVCSFFNFVYKPILIQGHNQRVH